MLHWLPLAGRARPPEIQTSKINGQLKELQDGGGLVDASAIRSPEPLTAAAQPADEFTRHGSDSSAGLQATRGPANEPNRVTKLRPAADYARAPLVAPREVRVGATAAPLSLVVVFSSRPLWQPFSGRQPIYGGADGGVCC
jgi:hypothetical protein